MLDKARIKASFSRRAGSYDKAAGLQREVGLRLISRIRLNRHPVRILDIGMGTGFLARRLCRRHRSLSIFGCDIAHGMNLYARRRLGQSPRPIYPLTADAEQLCYKDGQIDLIISNLSYQWLNHIDQGLSEARRVLKPGGKLIFTTLGDKTLQELRSCFHQAYRGVKGEDPGYTHRFISQAELLRLMNEAGFCGVEIESRLYQRWYQGVNELLNTLKQLGATNASADKPQGLASKAVIQRLQQLYRQKYAADGRISASYEVLFASGRK
jgi:malonyl-CoA O-methyltransferase